MSDGHAVQELLKITKLLYEASKQSVSRENDENDITENILSDPTILTKVFKNSRIVEHFWLSNFKYEQKKTFFRSFFTET